MSVPFAIYDVFADEPFFGNPAGVIRAGERRISDTQLVALSSELTLPETAVSQWDGSALTLRFATSAGIINRCGHATLASIADHVLAQDPGDRGDKRGWCGLYRIGSAEGEWRARIALARGPPPLAKGLCIEVAWPDRPRWMRRLPSARVYAALGRKPADAATGFGPCIYDSGNRNALVSLASPDLLDQIQVSWRTMEKLFHDYGITDLHVYSLVHSSSSAGPLRIRCRNLFPYGVMEEAATGTASISLAAFLINKLSSLTTGLSSMEFLLEQGCGARRGRIMVAWKRSAAGDETYWLKGQVFMVMRGELVTLPNG
jgi:predicted PhzF superfamily epimerase YddE/YHI9